MTIIYLRTFGVFFSLLFLLFLFVCFVQWRGLCQGLSLFHCGWFVFCYRCDIFRCDLFYLVCWMAFGVMMMMPTFGAFAFDTHSFLNVPFSVVLFFSIFFSFCSSYSCSSFRVYSSVMVVVAIEHSPFVCLSHRFSHFIVIFVSLFLHICRSTLCGTFHCKFYLTSIFFVSCSKP